MPRNLEIKVKVDSLVPYRRRAAALPGCRKAGVLRQTDRYFRGARGYLKLRVVAGGVSELIAYERPKRRGVRESRFVTCPVEAPGATGRVLTAAFGADAVVKKTRELFLLDDARIHLDRVSGLGAFVEIEVLTERAGGRAAGLMRDLCEYLQLPAETTPGSYRDLMGGGH